jgi:hypothetical protein
VAHKMVRRILSVIKNNKPYEINKNLTLDQSIQLSIDYALTPQMLKADPFDQKSKQS